MSVTSYELDSKLEQCKQEPRNWLCQAAGGAAPSGAGSYTQ